MRKALKDMDRDVVDITKERIELRLPFPGHCFRSEQHAPKFTVKDIPMRRLIDVIVDMCEDANGRKIEYQPFEQFYQASTWSAPARVLSEVFDSPAMVEMAESLQRRARHPEDPEDMPYAPLGIILYSDSTQLSSSGNNTVWPVYVSLANHARADRARLGRQCQQELMMLPKASLISIFLPNDLIHVWIAEKERLDKEKGIRRKYSKKKTVKHPMPDAVKAFLKRELLQKAWHKQLLDPSFKAACEDGIIVQCGDGVTRRLFPKIMLYSADLQEKSYMSGYTSCATQCPLCVMSKSFFANIGKASDKAERKRSQRVDSHAMQKAVLKARKRIFVEGKSILSKYVQSLLKPFGCSATLMELGVIKNIVTYFYKIALHSGTIDTMDKRFAQIPRFGEAIRKFRASVTAAEGMTAREYEQVLLFALAKLHMHTAETLEDMDNELSTFGRTLRAFKAKGDTWQAQQVAKGSTSLDKPWSIQTPKTHTMGHTLSSVQVFGPTVGYTTEMGEQQHKNSKSSYANTNKGQSKDLQIAKRVTQKRHMDRFCTGNQLRRSKQNLRRPTVKAQSLSSDRKIRVRAVRGCLISDLVQSMRDDQSCNKFTLRLKRHLWSRLSISRDQEEPRSSFEIQLPGLHKE
ncbi:hypothetical protein C356_00984 [Cryptococcus neoformans c45]|nr:hypothetical protein C356_00984 [Cryptococcus neoformans var. grubii c45]